jgi:hypothetical protein
MKDRPRSDVEETVQDTENTSSFQKLNFEYISHVITKIAIRDSSYYPLALPNCDSLFDLKYV